MAGKKRAKSDAQRPLPGLHERKGSSSTIPSPVSPMSPMFSRREVKEFVREQPSMTPEEWVDFALKKIWEIGKPVDAVWFLAMQQEPDLLEFLITGTYLDSNVSSLYIEPYVPSSANEDIREAVREAACGGGFPSTRATWVDSLSHILIDRFRHYLNRLPPSLVDRQVSDACRLVPNVVAALGTLDQFSFETASGTQPEEVDPIFKKKKSQKERKAGTLRARTNTVVVDSRIFAAIDFDVPTNPDELSVTEVCLLNRLRELLEVTRFAHLH